MKLSNKVYDIMKWVVLILMPALITFYGLLASTLNFPNTEIVLTIMGGFTTFLGSILGISTSSYKKESDQ